MVIEALMRALDRRSMLRGMAASVAGLWMNGCTSAPTLPDTRGPRLSARPHAPGNTIQSGVHDISGAVGSDVTLYVPEGYDPAVPLPLFMALHGAGPSREMMHNFYPVADEARVLLLIPKSRAQTWDMIVGGYGPDITTIDNAFEYAFDHCAVDLHAVILGGFSDGASYALSVGLQNGDLINWITGFSPGFARVDEFVGKPNVFISHGTQDTILPVGLSRQIVAELRQLNYNVTYREFDGPHTIPITLLREALDLAKAGAAASG